MISGSNAGDRRSPSVSILDILTIPFGLVDGAIIIHTVCLKSDDKIKCESDGLVMIGITLGCAYHHLSAVAPVCELVNNITSSCGLK